MAANRRVDAAGHVEVLLADHFGIQVGAHAVQALVLVGLGHARNGGWRRWCARCGWRTADRNSLPSREHLLRAGEVGNIGVRLAREHRVAGKPSTWARLTSESQYAPLTRRTHQRRRLCLRASFGQPVDHERRALLVGLHRQAKAVPAGERGWANTAPITSSESSSRSASSASMVSRCAVPWPVAPVPARAASARHARARAWRCS
jgi:hypothetical protein